jgi:hypothetical protein
MLNNIIPELIPVGALASLLFLVYLGKANITIKFMGNTIEIISK